MPFDGFKISISEQVGKSWLTNSLLSFQYVVNTSTGESMDGKRWATYNGLTFFIVKSKLYDGLFYYTVKGSFHKYHNKGLHNYNDFTFLDFLDVLKDLENKFNIDLKNTSLQRLEFGLNIELTTPIKPIIDGIRAYKNTEFTYFRECNAIVGTHTKTKRTETKIYNKSKQFKLTDKNIIRFEYVLKNIEVFNKYGIYTLEDLTNKSLVLQLGKIIFDTWNDSIFYDGGINIKNWKHQKAKKFLRYLDAKYWTNLCKKQRYRSKQNFFNIIMQNDTKQTQYKMAQIIALKWHYLTALLCPPLEHHFDFTTALEMSTFGTLEYSYQWWTNSIKEQNQKKPQKALKKDSVFDREKQAQKKAQKRLCSVCSISIENKRKNTKYCSKKCNNTLNGKKRTSKRKKIRMQEIENLKKLLSKIHLNKFSLIIFYKSNNVIYSDQLHQTEICTTKEYINKITKVEINTNHRNAPPVKLTTLRAKQLIRNINNHNLK